MSNEDILSIKCRILDLFSELQESELETIESWICSRSYKDDLKNKKNLKISEKYLDKIANAIKKIVPFEAEMPSEKIVPPTIGDQADCSKVNTCHVDEFLYDEVQVTQLVKKGKLKRHYCLECHSRNVDELIFISHSMSKQALQYIFKVLLPNDMDGKQILDVGSRLGVVLYAAYYYSNAPTIVGVEMNKECCDIQEKIVNQFNMDKDRIKVIHADIMARQDIIQSSNVIIINVLDFFVDIEKHKEMWHFFKRYIKKGSYLISNRSMAETLNTLDIYEQFMDWLSVCKPNQLENEVFFDVEDYNEHLKAILRISITNMKADVQKIATQIQPQTSH